MKSHGNLSLGVGKKHTVNTHKAKGSAVSAADEDNRVGTHVRNGTGFAVRDDLGSNPVPSSS